MKKVIRLTESDLHRIIKESVNKILSEAINELDPRTYASYADKRRVQAQNANDYSDMSKYTSKANAGEEAARNAWNNKYGHDDNYAHGYSKENMIDTSDSPYAIHTQSMSRDALGNAVSNNVNQVNPQNDKRTADRYRVAQQMAQGNGKYIKGQGWQ